MELSSHQSVLACPSVGWVEVERAVRRSFLCVAKGPLTVSVPNRALLSKAAVSIHSLNSSEFDMWMSQLDFVGMNVSLLRVSDLSKKGRRA